MELVRGKVMKDATFNRLKTVGEIFCYSIILLQLFWISDPLLYSHISGDYKLNKNPVLSGKLALYADRSWKCFGPALKEKIEVGYRSSVSYIEGTWSKNYFNDTLELIESINHQDSTWIFLKNGDSLNYQKTVLK